MLYRLKTWWKHGLYLYENKLIFLATGFVFAAVLVYGSKLQVHASSFISFIGKAALLIGLEAQLIAVLFLFRFPDKKQVINKSRRIAFLGIMIAFLTIWKGNAGILSFIQLWFFLTGLMFSLLGGLLLVQTLIGQEERDKYFTIVNISGLYMLVSSQSTFHNMLSHLAMTTAGIFLFLVLINALRGIAVFANLSVLGKARAQNIFNSLWIGIIADLFLQFAEIWLFLAMIPLAWIGFLKADEQTRLDNTEICKIRCYQWVKPTLYFSFLAIALETMSLLASRAEADLSIIFLVLLMLGYSILAYTYLSIRFAYYAVLFSAFIFFILRSLHLTDKIMDTNPFVDAVGFFLLFSCLSIIILTILFLCIKQGRRALQGTKSLGISVVLCIIAMISLS